MIGSIACLLAKSRYLEEKETKTWCVLPAKIAIDRECIIPLFQCLPIVQKTDYKKIAITIESCVNVFHVFDELVT